MEAFDNNETGIMLWDPDDVLVYINKATQDFINSLGATISIGIKFEDFTKNLLNIKSFSEEHGKKKKNHQTTSPGNKYTPGFYTQIASWELGPSQRHSHFQRVYSSIQYRYYLSKNNWVRTGR